MLNCRGEKTSSLSFYKAITQIQNSWKDANIIDYTSVESSFVSKYFNMISSLDRVSHKEIPFYIIFMEIDSKMEIDIGKNEHTKNCYF